MKRSTPEQHRWQNELRRDARIPTSSTSLSVKPPIARREMGPTRSGVKATRKNDRSCASAALVATAALRTYLSNDTDAQSGLSLLRPVPESRREEISRPTNVGRRLSNANSIKWIESRCQKDTQLRASIDLTVNTMDDIDARETHFAESPLSRFQKHVQQSRLTTGHKSLLQPDRKISDNFSMPCHHTFEREISTARTAETEPTELNRSLTEKIQEAKRLRRVETVSDNRNGHYQYTGPQGPSFNGSRVLEVNHPIVRAHFKADSALTEMPTSSASRSQGTSLIAAEATVVKTFPPIPHPKPVKPVIPLLPSPTPPSPPISELQAESAKCSSSKTAMSSVNDVILATKAASLIQRVWRRCHRRIQCRRERLRDNAEKKVSGGTETSLIIDKFCDDKGIFPLFSAVRMRCKQTVHGQKHHYQQEDTAASPDKEDDILQTCRSMIHETETYLPTDAETCQPTYHPWTDHDLIYLEEGRCIRELEDAVRNGNFMDRDELIWKRPQYVIQQLENQRISTIQRARKNRPPSSQAKAQVVVVASQEGDTEDHLEGDATNAIPLTESTSQENISRIKPNEIKGSEKTRRLFRVHIHKPKRTSRKAPFRRMNLKGAWKPIVRTHCCESQHQEAKIAARGLTESGKLKSEDCYKGLSIMTEADSGPKEFAATSIDTSDNIMDCFDSFVVFSGSTTSRVFNEVDTEQSRNDLISVGDLTVVRTLLHDEYQHPERREAGDVDERLLDFIPITDMVCSRENVEFGDRDKIIPEETMLMCASSYNGGNEGLDALCANRSLSGSESDCSSKCWSIFDSDSDAPKLTLHQDKQDDNLAQGEHTLTWEHTSSQMESLHPYSNNCVMLASTTESTSRAKDLSKQLWVADELDAPSQQCSSPKADPMLVLKGMKSTVAETMARIHTDFRGNVASQEPCALISQQSEALLSTPTAMLEIVPAKPHLDEAKRMEFLRVLNDFKRCLRSSSASSSPSSTISASISTYQPPSMSVARNKYRNTTARIISNEVESDEDPATRGIVAA